MVNEAEQVAARDRGDNTVFSVLFGSYMISPILAFVAMFDIIGFKNLRRDRGSDGLYKLYQRALLPLIQHAAAMRGKTIQRGTSSLFVPDFGLHSIEYRVVSDSILLFSAGNTFDDFLKIIGASHNLLCGGFAGHYAPLRGAIGYGDLILDSNSIWIGSAIEDAYIGEGSQAWAGCCLTVQCETLVSTSGFDEIYRNLLLAKAQREDDPTKRQKLSNAARRLVTYPIPIQHTPKDGPTQYTTREGMALDWTLNVYDGAAEKSFSASSNAHAQRIQANTVAFEKWARARPVVCSR